MRLILHIGGAKCGSTAIQYLLRNNHEKLAKEHGILIPGTRLQVGQDITGEQIFFFERMIADKKDGLSIVQKRLRQLHAYMQHHEMHTLIVSGENLINPAGFETFFVEAQDLFDIEIILYIRRQDQYFVSAWQQWHLKSFDNLQAYVDQRLGHDANWHKFLTPWENTLDKAQITLRRFQRDLLIGQDIKSDFINITGLQDVEWDFGEKDSNMSFNEHLGDIACRIQDVFSGPHDNAFFATMYDAIGPGLFKTGKGSILFSLAERQKIFAAYTEGNANLKAKYFPELSEDELLFVAPSENEVIPMSEDEKRRAEIDLMARAVLNLTQRLKALENK